jgi:hypothetical protein
VLGVGSIPSVELGSGNYRSQSTYVPLNGAYILSEDQTGASTQFGSSRNYFDYGIGTKNTIATYSTNFAGSSANFSTAEQGSLVSQQISGVCNSSSGCTGSFGIQSSVNSYSLYPMALGDFINVDSGDALGKFGGTAAGRSVSTGSPSTYYLRAPRNTNASNAPFVYDSGGWSVNTVSTNRGFRPAGVLNLESVLLSRGGQI